MLELLLDSTSMQTIVLTKDGCGTKKTQQANTGCNKFKFEDLYFFVVVSDKLKKTFNTLKVDNELI
ncbi:MAG TPA: hypothetical protein PKO43_03355 [Bacilli bacterium]|nr:hypothetical protein [Bacilli bacterium]HQD92696.1 hypothetical protein [Bacilli bacterium]